MKTLLLSIVGPDRSLDLAVSGDLPLEELIPTLLETGVVAAEETSGRRWTLAPLGGGPLALEQTLTESGVLDGQVLLLRPLSDRPEAPQRIITRPHTLVAGSPLARRREALPSQPTLGERLGGGGRYLARLDGAIKAAPLRRCATIAVISPKGGVGKSTVSVLLGSLFSRLRSERAVAIDMDSDYGSLGPWLAPSHAVSVSELATELGRPGYPASELEEQLALGPDGLRLCPAPRDPALMADLDRDRYARLIARLQGLVGILILDCGTGLGLPGTQAAILASDQLVLVSDAEPATLGQVGGAAGLLRHAGPPVTVVLNRSGLAGEDAEHADSLFPYASGLLSISSDTGAARSLSSGGFSWEAAPGSWQREVRELAATLVWAWPQLRLSEPPATA